MAPTKTRTTDPGGVFNSDEERRVLATLPAWRNDEDHWEVTMHLRDERAIPEDAEAPRGRTLEDLTKRVSTDPHAKLHNATEVAEVVLDLENEGLVERVADEIRMTEAGLTALQR